MVVQYLSMSRRLKTVHRTTDRAGVNSDEYSADDVIEYEWVAAELKEREPEYTTVAPLKYGPSPPLSPLLPSFTISAETEAM